VGERLSDDQMEEFLAGAQPEAAETARAVRVKLLGIFPDAIETAEGGELGLGFDRGYEGLVFTVSPQRGYVNLGVARGASLDDPAGLLEGRGRVHRHVKIRSVEELADARLDDLLGRAVAARRAQVAT
jgi:hypothetical protein